MSGLDLSGVFRGVLAYLKKGGGPSSSAPQMQIPVHRGQPFRRIADSVPVIADSF